MVNYTLLEITTRPFLRILSEKYSRPITKLVDIPETVFDEWKEMGFDWIWMMGIWQLGEYGLNHDRTSPARKAKYDTICPGWQPEDVIGSPYAVVSYTINPELGEEKDILWLRDQLHKRGMKLMLDFVPNHTAFDSVELAKDNKREFYIHYPETASETLPDSVVSARYGPNKIAFGHAFSNFELTQKVTQKVYKPWTDVAQLNYMNVEMRASRVEIIKKIASQCDGIRCDVADAVLNDGFWRSWEFELTNCGYKKLESEFWADAISAVKKEHQNCVFLAEANYDSKGVLKKCGFDYVYDRILFKELEKRPTVGFSTVKTLINNPEVSRYSHMIENHDEKRSLTAFSNNFLKEHAAAVTALTLPGLRFVNQDQWCGYTHEIGVHLRRAVKEAPNEEFVTFYRRLFDVLKFDALRNGTFSVIQNLGCPESALAIAWRFVGNRETVDVFVSFHTKPVEINCEIGDKQGEVMEVEDLFAGGKIKLDKANELKVKLEQYQFLVIKY